MDPELRRQLDAAWESQVDRLFGGWKRQVESAVTEHLRLQQSRGNVLNQSVRRLRQAETHAEWVQVLLESAVQWCSGAGLCSTLNQQLRCEGVRGLPESLTGIEMPLTSAPAFASCAESQDPVVAIASAGELSGAIAECIRGNRVHLFPLASSGKVQAILFAEAATDPEHLELLASVAGATLADRTAAPQAAGLLTISSVPAAKPKDGWDALPKPERQLHLKAQRFAVVRVSKIRMERAGNVEAGRAGGNLYGAVKSEIDLAREEFRQNFMEVSPTMVDYIHLEMLRVLVNNDNAQFGPDYPGPLA
jgi:hypothetical protein